MFHDSGPMIYGSAYAQYTDTIGSEVIGYTMPGIERLYRKIRKILENVYINCRQILRKLGKHFQKNR